MQPVDDETSTVDRFRVELYPERNVVRVAPFGELDLAVSDQLDQRLAELYASGFRRFVLDLRDLSFIDSSGLGVIVRWHTHAEERGMSFELIRGSRGVQRLFEITGIADRLAFVDR
jgi:anti-anti-sigma factor